MSEGPIKAWRDAHKPPRVSTPDNYRVCYQKLGARRSWCGRRPKVAYDDWTKVTCADCLAAREADRIAAGSS